MAEVWKRDYEGGGSPIQGAFELFNATLIALVQHETAIFVMSWAAASPFGAKISLSVKVAY